MRIVERPAVKKFLRFSCAGTVLLAAASAHAQAQTPALATEEPTVIEDVVVTGYALANQRGIQAKRRADSIQDVISADDLNALPDQNLAEAISRAPGVTAFQDEGAGLYVGIRGLSQEFVNLTVDSLPTSSASRTWDGNLRGANLEAVPASFVRQVEVIKAITPDKDGDAIAGTVNLVTRSALDGSKPWISMGLSAGRYQEDVPPDSADISSRGNISFGRTFGNEDQFGLVIDADFRNISRDNLKPNAYFGTRSDILTLPEEVGGYFYQRDESSLGLAGKLEMQAGDWLRSFISARYSDSETHVDKHKHALYAAQSDTAAGTFTGGVGTVRDDAVTYGVDGALTLSAGTEWILNERNTLSLRGSTSKSRAYQDDPRVDWYFGGPLDGSYAYTGRHYDYQFSPASGEAFIDPSNYAFNGYRRFQDELDKGVDSLKLDWTNSSPDGRGLGFRSGVQLKETSVDYASSYLRWRNPQAAISASQFLAAHDYRFPDTVLVGDASALSRHVEALGAAGFKRTEGYDNANDYGIVETVGAVYALADYASEKWRVIGGLRFEATETEASVRFNRQQDAPFVKTASEYNDLLPSIAATYFINDSWLLRAGVSRTIGRPDVLDLAQGETPPNSSGVYRRGNPDLQPRRSNNFDLSLEHYFDKGDSLFSAAIFRKEIEDEIFELQTPYRFTDEFGVERDSYYLQPENAGDAVITGLELSLSKNRFGFLPGALSNLGASVNLTLLDGELNLVDANGAVTRTVRPESMSDHLANLTLFYEGEKFSGRISHRIVGEQAQQLSLDGSGDLILDSYRQTDLQISYKIRPKWEVVLDVWNLFEDEQTFTNQNLVTGAPNWYEGQRFGRAVWLGLNYSF